MEKYTCTYVSVIVPLAREQKKTTTKNEPNPF